MNDTHNRYKINMTQTKDNVATQIVLPVNPDEIGIKYSMDNKKYNVLSIGEVIKAGYRGLKTFTIKSDFPQDEDPSSKIKQIQLMMESQLPVQVVMSSIIENVLAFDLNLSTLIDSFSYEEKGGEVGCIYYTLEFTEFRTTGTKVTQDV